MLVNFTTNISQQNLRNIAKNGVFAVEKRFSDRFHSKFHNNLNSNVADFIINQNVWIKISDENTVLFSLEIFSNLLVTLFRCSKNLYS